MVFYTDYEIDRIITARKPLLERVLGMNGYQELVGILAPYGSLSNVSLISKVGAEKSVTSGPDDLPGPVDTISSKPAEGPGPI